MNKLFQRIIWHNNTTPAINETNLNAISKGLDDLDDRVIELADKIFEVLPLILQTLQEVQETLTEVQALETRLEEMFDRQIRSFDVWTTPVTVNSGTSSVTIRDAAILTDSYVEIWLYNSSGNRKTVSRCQITAGQCIVTFAKPLTETTGVQLQIKNVRAK